MYLCVDIALRIYIDRNDNFTAQNCIYLHKDLNFFVQIQGNWEVWGVII